MGKLCRLRGSHGLGFRDGASLWEGSEKRMPVPNRLPGEKRPQDCPKESSRSELGRNEGGVGRGEK